MNTCSLGALGCILLQWHLLGKKAPRIYVLSAECDLPAILAVCHAVDEASVSLLYNATLSVKA